MSIVEIPLYYIARLTIHKFDMIWHQWKSHYFFNLSYHKTGVRKCILIIVRVLSHDKIA